MSEWILYVRVLGGSGRGEGMNDGMGGVGECASVMRASGGAVK